LRYDRDVNFSQKKKDQMQLRNSEFDKFARDPRVLEIGERLKATDNVLDIISFVENQHSNIMSWLLDSREGHGQSDEILKDLLAHASSVANRKPRLLDGKTKTSKFFDYWTPLRLHTSSFASSFILRELGLGAQQGNSRLDMLVVDPQNKFVLVLENKAGTPQTEGQLSAYKAAVDNLLNVHRELKGYKVALIAMDRNFDERGDDSYVDEVRPVWGSSWVGISYGWLKASAKRAELQMERGNSSAALVMNYCRAETDWESPDWEILNKLAFELSQEYPIETKELLQCATNPWQKWRDRSVKLDPSAWQFVLQNRSLIDLLSGTYGVPGVLAEIRQMEKSIPETNLYTSRTNIHLCPGGAEGIVSESNYWGVCLVARCPDADRTLFDISLRYLPSGYGDTSDLHRVKACLDGVFPKLHSNDLTRGKNLKLDSKLTSRETAKKLVEYWRKATDAIQSSK